MTEAILTLVGVAMGAVLAGGARYLLDRRAERDRFRAAVWMLFDDLDRMRAVIDPAKGAPGPMGTPRSQLAGNPDLVGWLSSDAWKSQRQVLALGLGREPKLWNQIRWAMFQADVLARLSTLDGKDMDSITRRIMTQDELLGRVESLVEQLAVAVPPGTDRRPVGRSSMRGSAHLKRGPAPDRST